MKEQVISFETAKLAKEKGFNEICTSHYLPEKQVYSADKPKSLFESALRYSRNKESYDYGAVVWFRNSDLHDENNGNGFRLDKGYTAPTQSLLQKWLREEHGIDIQIRRLCYRGSFREEEWDEYNDFIYMPGQNDHLDITLGNEFDTHEEALENALQESLKLI
jgi:hypothetical protein